MWILIYAFILFSVTVTNSVERGEWLCSLLIHKASVL